MIPFTNYYGMQFNPFDKELSSRDAFSTFDLEQMKGRLEHLKEHPGIGLFTAAPGMGKTFALRSFADSLNPNLVKFYYVSLSTVSTMEFYRQLCTILGLETSCKKTIMFQRIQDYLYSMSTNKNIHCIICLDEAQYLNADIFKDLKMLCNFCMDSKNCFSLILHEPERRAQTKSYMWLFRSGEDGDFPIIIYKYSETRAGDTAVDFLDGFRGYLMCDGYSGYNKVKTAKRLACWAHIRRYLIDAIPKGKQLDYAQPAVQGVMYTNQLFDIEDKIRQKYKTFDAIKEARLKQEKPIIEGFLSWLERQNPVRNSRLDKAVTYIRNRKDYLASYLDDGRCSFSNNLSENCIRPFVVGRKGWLFCDTPAGAQASAMAYTMVEMAKANKVNVYHYLTFLFDHQPSRQMTDEELEQLAPWNEDVKSEIQRRVDTQNNE